MLAPCLHPQPLHGDRTRYRVSATVIASNATRSAPEAFLANLFVALDEARLNYCLLRQSLAEPNDCNQEVDLLVSTEHLARLAEVLTKHKFTGLSSWGHAPHHFFVTYRKDCGVWLKLDVVTDLRYGRPIQALRIEGAETCLRRRHRRDSTYVLTPAHEVVTLFLHCLIDRGEFEPQYRARLTELRLELEKDPELCATGEVERVLAPALTWKEVSKAIASADWKGLVCRRSSVWRLLFWRGPLRNAWYLCSGWLARRLRPIQLVLQQPGFLVVLIAPDGGGKTTLARQLAQDCVLRARHIYMGTNSQASTVGLPTTRWFRPRKAAEKQGVSLARAILAGLSFANRVVEQWVRFGVARYQKLRGRVVVCDRFIYDSWVNSQPTTPWKRFRRWLLEVGCPKPDLVVYLSVPTKELCRRKQEHSCEWLERQQGAYLALKDRLPELAVVDGTPKIADVRRTVIGLIWDKRRARAMVTNANRH